jgi:hypothetical protein
LIPEVSNWDGIFCVNQPCERVCRGRKVERKEKGWEEGIQNKQDGRKEGREEGDDGNGRHKLGAQPTKKFTAR